MRRFRSRMPINPIFAGKCRDQITSFAASDRQLFAAGKSGEMMSASHIAIARMLIWLDSLPDENRATACTGDYH